MATSPHPRSRVFNMRLTDDEAAQLHSLAERRGYKSTSEFLRDLVGSQTPSISSTASKQKVEAPNLFMKTRLGRIYHGDSIGLLSTTLRESSVDLIVTSPPFGLVKKKAYGNAPADEYLDWFRPFAEGMRRVLKENGSLVIDIGPAWTRGIPTKSLYQFELLTMLCREFEFHLAQDFYWWNPCRMPAPAEWVNVRRLRAKDAVNPIWWLSPTPWPKASNRRVLTGYGKDQQKLFRNGYNAGKRPSGHVVSANWGKDNGGAVPPNLIAAPNTISDDPYQVYCREKEIEPHPARFPWALPEFFIRMLTDQGDLVADPFGGSCLTGAVAEHLKRKWVCGEVIESYLLGAVGRFEKGNGTRPPRVPQAGYRVPTISEVNSADADNLLPCGGKDARAKKKATQEDSLLVSSSSKSKSSARVHTPRKRS
ncbi:MAG: site-specific DNA-methyltransferase [Lysobacter sp.]|nr:site-specific DNA-methyltransferase [Lysobacter sp.]